MPMSPWTQEELKRRFARSDDPGIEARRQTPPRAGDILPPMMTLRSTRALLPLTLVVFAAACGGSEASSGSTTGSGGASSGSTTGSGGASSGSTTGSGGASSGSTTGSGGASSGSTTGSGEAGSGSTTGSGEAASGGAGGTGGAGGMVEGPGTDTTVTPFVKTPIYFTSDDDQRVVDAPVSFPSTGTYERITLHLSLECPSGGCDPWARLASLGLVTARDPAGDTVIELMRFITPYRVGASWDLDVTDLRPLLAGEVTLRAFIDTQVGPGSPYGDGWLLNAGFEMKGGLPAKIPVAVIPVWSQRRVVYGDPARPIAGAVPLVDVPLPVGASSYALRSFITGHGQGNAGNCAEFCEKEHTLTVGAVPHAETIWRDDCATTAVPGQQGTYKYARAGWCSGADVRPWTVDITADVAGRGSAKMTYDVAAYENTCRPDSVMCNGCTPGNGCTYDGATHTEPGYELSTVLIGYR
ncbi:peptide-N-glycosidase F-related protein [Sorangium sp. So ce1000]|uniref:peptide-N-glycosidase F-related protein n=1 Tax=Sorangium sp. So ce1000 TaxID=3133325 RepID=UPI003F61F1DE